MFHARGEVPFKLILWSPSKEALAAFTSRSQLNIDPNQAQPEAIKLLLQWRERERLWNGQCILVGKVTINTREWS